MCACIQHRSLDLSFSISFAQTGCSIPGPLSLSLLRLVAGDGGARGIMCSYNAVQASSALCVSIYRTCFPNMVVAFCVFVQHGVGLILASSTLSVARICDLPHDHRIIAGLVGAAMGGLHHLHWQGGLSKSHCHGYWTRDNNVK